MLMDPLAGRVFETPALERQLKPFTKFDYGNTFVIHQVASFQVSSELEDV